MYDCQNHIISLVTTLEEQHRPAAHMGEYTGKAGLLTYKKKDRKVREIMVAVLTSYTGNVAKMGRTREEDSKL